MCIISLSSEANEKQVFAFCYLDCFIKSVKGLLINTWQYCIKICVVYQSCMVTCERACCVCYTFSGYILDNKHGKDHKPTTSLSLNQASCDCMLGARYHNNVDIWHNDVDICQIKSLLLTPRKLIGSVK
jgi:hypothetical protein